MESILFLSKNEKFNSTSAQVGSIQGNMNVPLTFVVCALVQKNSSSELVASRQVELLTKQVYLFKCTSSVITELSHLFLSTSWVNNWSTRD